MKVIPIITPLSKLNPFKVLVAYQNIKGELQTTEMKTTGWLTTLCPTNKRNLT